MHRPQICNLCIAKSRLGKEKLKFMLKSVSNFTAKRNKTITFVSLYSGRYILPGSDDVVYRNIYIILLI